MRGRRDAGERAAYTHHKPQDRQRDPEREARAEVRQRSQRPKRPRPSKLVDEEAPYVRLRDDVVDEIRDERDAQPQAADEPAEHVVVREVIRQGIEAADRAERLAPARDRRAKRVMQWLDV